MEGTDQLDEEHVFKVNFTGDGVGRLRDRVKEKLKEFMGDYTDDTLVVCCYPMPTFFSCHVIRGNVD